MRARVKQSGIGGKCCDAGIAQSFLGAEKEGGTVAHGTRASGWATVWLNARAEMLAGQT
jgi:hypothetical protein